MPTAKEQFRQIITENDMKLRSRFYFVVISTKMLPVQRLLLPVCFSDRNRQDAVNLLNMYGQVRASQCFPCKLSSFLRSVKILIKALSL